MTAPASNPPTLAALVRELARPPRLALRPEEAAEALGCSRDFFDEHVMPELRVVRRGRLRIIPVKEIEKWLEREAARTLD